MIKEFKARFVAEQPAVTHMPSLIDIRRRIRSVKNTQQITKAMKMVSAAKLRRAQDRVIAARPYGALLRKVLANVAAAAAADESDGGRTRCWPRGPSSASCWCWSPATKAWPARSTPT